MAARPSRLATITAVAFGLVSGAPTATSALLVGHEGDCGQHEAAGDLRHEQPEQRERGVAVDETGGEAEQRRDPGRDRLRTRSDGHAHRFSHAPIRSTASRISAAEPA
jgi:hypothetical protein